MQFVHLTGKNLKTAENRGRSEEAKEGQRGKREKKEEVDQLKRLKIEDFYTSGMEETGRG